MVKNILKKNVEKDSNSFVGYIEKKASICYFKGA